MSKKTLIIIGTLVIMVLFGVIAIVITPSLAVVYHNVAIIDFDVSPNIVSPGDTFTMTTVVKNYGTVAERVLLKLSVQTLNGTREELGQWIIFLKVGESKTYTKSVVIPEEALEGVYTLYLNALIREDSNPADNEASEKIRVFIPSWEVTETNSGIEDIPTLHDFVPLGAVYEETEDHRLIYTDDPKWRLSCFILVAIGKTNNGDTILFQGRLPFSGEGGGRDIIFINGKWHSPWGFYGPMYYDDEKRIYPYPTVYTKGLYSNGEECIGSISYNEQEREWIYKVTPLSGEGIIFELCAKARATPFWMGKQEGPYIIHGAIFNKEDIDIWGGFWEIGEFEGKLTVPNYGDYSFNGSFLFDRATHRVYYTESAFDAAGAPLSFSCLYMSQEDLDITISMSENPSPIQTPVPFQHQGRINFITKGKDFTFDKFQFSDSGGLQPNKYYLTGEYEGGEVNLTGEVFKFWPENWGINNGTWWDLEAKRTWGRAFVNWKGTVTLDNETISVDALGVGEITRFEAGF